MVQFTGEEWAVPGVMVGSGKQRLLFGSFEGDELMLKDEDALPTSGETPEDTRYAIYYVEVADEEDKETWTQPVHLGNLFGPDEYNLLYDVMQSIVLEQEEGEPNA